MEGWLNQRVVGVAHAAGVVDSAGVLLLLK